MVHSLHFSVCDIFLSHICDIFLSHIHDEDTVDVLYSIFTTRAITTIQRNWDHVVFLSVAPLALLMNHSLVGQEDDVETSTSVTTGKKYVSIKKVGSLLNGKRVRINDSQEFQCTFSESKNLFVGGSPWKEFIRLHGFSNREEAMAKIEVFDEAKYHGWVTLETLSKADDPRYLLNAVGQLNKYDICTITAFHSQPPFAYKIKRDLSTGKDIPLLRVCNEVHTGDIFRSSLSEDVSLRRYIEQMYLHVKNGSRTTSYPFFSASTNIDVIRYHSCGFLRPVIWIDQEKVKHRAFEVGSIAGKQLFGLNDSSMAQNFAHASEEVLIADTILSSHYEGIKVRFEKERDLYINPLPRGKRKFPTMESLRNDYEQIRVDAEGIIICKPKDSSKTKLVVKVGRNKGMGANNHVANEFFTSLFYNAMGVPVPDSILRSCDVKVHCGDATSSIEIYDGEVFYLIREFIDGPSPTLDSTDTKRLISRGCFADIVLANFDVLGANHLGNLKMMHGEVYRIDCGAGLFTKHQGEMKVDFAIDKRKLSDVKNDIVKFFSIKSKETAEIWKLFRSNPEYLFDPAEECLNLYWQHLTHFAGSINSNSPIPFFWNELRSLVTARLNILLSIKTTGITRNFWSVITSIVSQRQNGIGEHQLEESGDFLPDITSSSPLTKRQHQDEELFAAQTNRVTTSTALPSSHLNASVLYISCDGNKYKPTFFFRKSTVGEHYLRNDHLLHLYKEHLRAEEFQPCMDRCLSHLLQHTAHSVCFVGDGSQTNSIGSKFCELKAIKDVFLEYVRKNLKHFKRDRNDIDNAVNNDSANNTIEAELQRESRKRNTITIAGKGCKQKESKYVINLTSGGSDKYFRKLSPFTAFHDGELRGFVVPGLANERSYSVEGVWQGLKLITNDKHPSGIIDKSKFAIKTGQKLKRKGKGILGHYTGDDSPPLSYIEARKKIYVPLYNEMLDKYCQEELEDLFELFLESDLIFLDYFVNEDIDCPDRPLSHASLVKTRLMSMFDERFIAEAGDDEPPLPRKRKSTSRSGPARKKLRESQAMESAAAV